MITKKEFIPKIAIVIHIHYVSTLGVIKKAIVNSSLNESDIYISLSPLASESIDEIQTAFPKAKIKVYENRGRDIRPFLRLLKDYKLPNSYDLVLKIHGKKTEALPGYGAFWLVDSLNKLIPKETHQLTELYKIIKSYGIAGPSKQLFAYDEKNDKNDKELKKTLGILNIQWKHDEPLYFFGGSMLWFETKFLKNFSAKITEADLFQEEKGQYDGTYAHAIERAFTIAPILMHSNKTLVVDFQNFLVRPMLDLDLSVDGLIREYEEFSGKAVLVSMSGSEYVLDYNDLKNLQVRRYEDKINSEQAIRTVDQPDNLHVLLIKTQEELARIKSSKKYRLLEKVSTAKAAVNPKRYKK